MKCVKVRALCSTHGTTLTAVLHEFDAYLEIKQHKDYYASTLFPKALGTLFSLAFILEFSFFLRQEGKLFLAHCRSTPVTFFLITITRSFVNWKRCTLSKYVPLKA